MNAETFAKAIEKATFDNNEIVIVSDGVTATIDVTGVGNDRLAHIEFPFDVKGVWGIIDTAKLIKSLKSVKGEINVLQKDEAFFIKGSSRKFKFPIVDDLGSMRKSSKLIPHREGCDITLNDKPATTLPVIFKPTDVKKMKADIRGEKEYQEKATITFKKSMNIRGKSTTDFELGDTFEGEFVVPFDEGSISAAYNGIHEVVKVLGGEDVTICMGQDDMIYIEEVDGDIKATYVIMPTEA